MTEHQIEHPQDPLEEAIVELAAMRDRAAQAEAIRDAHALEARDVEASAGASLLDSDDPEEAQRVAMRLGQLRASVELQDKVAAEARSRAAAIEARVLRAQAAQMEPAVGEARVALEQFDAKTDRLVRQLSDHTKFVVRVIDPEIDAHERMLNGETGPLSYATPPRWALAADAATAVRRHRLAVAIADAADGARSWAEVRDEFGPGPLSSKKAASWSDLPDAVRDGMIALEELWLRPPYEEHDWQAEYDDLLARLSAADSEVERAALQARRHSLKAAALDDGVQVREP